MPQRYQVEIAEIRFGPAPSPPIGRIPFLHGPLVTGVLPEQCYARSARVSALYAAHGDKPSISTSSPSDSSSSLQQQWQSNGSSHLHRPVPRPTAKRTAPRRTLTSSGPTPRAPLAGGTRAPPQGGGSAPRRGHGGGRIRTEGGGSGGALGGGLGREEREGCESARAHSPVGTGRQTGSSSVCPTHATLPMHYLLS
ncbi:unnamed protein product [Arctogadus glacialis]